jgi:hypothetical protein
MFVSPFANGVSIDKKASSSVTNVLICVYKTLWKK